MMMIFLNKQRYLLPCLFLITAFVCPMVQAQVAESDLEQRDGLWYEKGSETPYTGPIAEPDRMEGRMDAGKRVGEWIWYNAAGQREFMAVYDDEGQRVSSAGWHTNGQQSSAWTFKNNRPDGVIRNWDEQGQLRAEQSYKLGVNHGPYKVWDHHGALLYSADFVDGKLDGPAIWWYADGRKRWETNYTLGERTGTWAQYAPNGDLSMQSEWDDGTLISRHNPHENH